VDQNLKLFYLLNSSTKFNFIASRLVIFEYGVGIDSNDNDSDVV
jgi:hypothetical protein